MKNPLEGRVAIVTGGARGIGRGIALTLAGAGADILLTDRLDDALDATAREVRALGRRAAIAKVDVTQAAQVDAMVAQTPDDMGRLALFFATMDNVTGQAVNVGGGFTFH
nr:SDR family NAD(P)-dependent oxidoreductase [Burkholderia sp. BCC1977]